MALNPDIPKFLDNERVLLVRLGGFGDVVFTLPAVHLVRSSFPQTRLTYLVYKEFASLLQGFPGIDSVMTLDRTAYRGLNPVRICGQTFSLLSEVMRGRFKLAIDFQGFGETGLLTRLSGAPHRWGSVYRASRRWAYTRPVWRNVEFHPIEYHLDVLRQAGGLETKEICNEFTLPESVLEEARQFFGTARLDPALPTLFIQPFTSAPHKNWPLANYIATAQHWRGRGLQVLFGGGPGDRVALEPVRQAGFSVAAGVPALLSGAMVKLSTVVLGGDTGLMHLAVAMGKRVVMTMGSLQPGLGYPFGHRNWAVLPPNGAPVAAISNEEINRACAEALAEMGLSLAPAAG